MQRRTRLSLRQKRVPGLQNSPAPAAGPSGAAPAPKATRSSSSGSGGPGISPAPQPRGRESVDRRRPSLPRSVPPQPEPRSQRHPRRRLQLSARRVGSPAARLPPPRSGRRKNILPGRPSVRPRRSRRRRLLKAAATAAPQRAGPGQPRSRRHDGLRHVTCLGGGTPWWTARLANRQARTGSEAPPTALWPTVVRSAGRCAPCRHKGGKDRREEIDSPTLPTPPSFFQFGI